MNFIKTIFGAESTQYESTVERMNRVTHEVSGKIENQFKKVGAAIATYLSFNAIKGAIDDAIRYFDNLAHKAEQIGYSASFLQVFEHSMRSVGGASQQADKALADFGKKVGEAMQGTGELAGILDRLGISLYTADGAARPLTEIMGDYADAIANAATPQEKLYLSGKAFGEEAGPKMVEVLKDGAVGMNEMVAAFEKAHPEFDQTAKRLSSASQALEDIRTKMTIFVGETLGYWLENFSSFDNAVLESKRLFGDVFFGIGQLWADVAKTLTFGLVDFTDKALELRVKFDAWLVEGHKKTMEANAEQKSAIESSTESVNKQVSAIEGITEATDEAAKAAKRYAEIQNDLARRQREALANEAKARETINAQKDRQMQSDYGIVDRLYKQGMALQEIANRYPKLLEAAQLYSNLTGDTVTEIDKITEGVEKATDATRKLAEEAGNIDYPPPPQPGGTGGTGGGGAGETPPQPKRMGDFGADNTMLTNKGTFKSGGGVGGSFVGMNADLSSVSVSELLRMADELEEKKLKYSQSAGAIAGIAGGMQLNEMYSKTIQNILDNINKELYYRAQKEAGASAGMVPKAGYSTPEQYFKRLDDFIEKLYEKENVKDQAIEKTVKTTNESTDATKKLAGAIDRFAGSLERSSGRMGGYYRP